MQQRSPDGAMRNPGIRRSVHPGFHCVSSGLRSLIDIDDAGTLMDARSSRESNDTGRCRCCPCVTIRIIVASLVRSDIQKEHDAKT